MANYTNEEILKLPRDFRTNLINSLSGFKSPLLVGTSNLAGQQNLSLFSSVFHLGANPPLMGMIVRPDTVERHTLSNILETGVYTLNHLPASYVMAVHQTSARYPREASEFDATHLTPHLIKGFAAPAVAEASLRIGLALREKLDLLANGTHLLIGEVQWLEVNDEDLLTPSGNILLNSTPAVVGLDNYYTTNHTFRLTYAKPESTVAIHDNNITREA
jgi:flavin reductase (DIM6/NTAB) family NADH-FMN oxidoreductase RutF